MRYVVVLCLVLAGCAKTPPPAPAPPVAHGFSIGGPGLCRARSVRDPDLVV